MSTTLEKNKAKYQIVIGIDFGTSRSGFAYGWMNEQTKEHRKINLHTKWPDQFPETPYVKTPTLLLYSPNEEIAWGHEARTILWSLNNKDISKEYYLFERFKMKLYEGREYYENNGKKFLVLDLISDYLRKLKEYALKFITGNESGIIDENKILWSLTIPAMWTNQAKDIMIDAALKAGLIHNRADYGEHLVFVLEPEAAAIYCQHQGVVKTVPNLKPGVTFMVVDAGGGTVDITVHKVSSKGLEALAKSIGDAHGSTYVDIDFQKHLEKLLTPEILIKLAHLGLRGKWYSVDTIIGDMVGL